MSRRSRCSAYPTTSGVSGWSRSSSPTTPLTLARRARRSCSPREWAPRQLVTRRRDPAAAQRQVRPDEAAGRSREGLLDPAAHPLPRHHRARGRAGRGGGGLGRVQPVPGVRRRHRPRPGWPAPARRPTSAGPRRCVTSVPVNVTVPACSPEQAREIVLASAGCRTAKVKVAEPGQAPAEDEARLEAVRDALGPDGLVRIDANGGWSVDEAVARIAVLERAAGGLEYVEQPVASVEDLAVVRRRVAGADRRRRVDPPRGRPLPGARPRGRRHRRAQGAAAGRRTRLPADRRGHRPAGRRLERGRVQHRHRRRGRPRGGPARAARTPAGSRPCSCSTGDVVADPLLPVDGALPVRRPAVDAAGSTRWPPRRSGWSTGGAGWPRSRPCGRIVARDARLTAPSLTRARHLAGRPARGARADRRGALPGLAQRAALLRAARPTTGSGCTPGSTSAPRVPRPRPGQGTAPARRGRDHVRHRGGQPAPGRARGRPRRRTPRRGHRRPPGPAARHRRQPDHRPGAPLRRRGQLRRPRPSPPPDALDAAWLPGGPVHLNCQLDEPLVPEPDSPERSRTTDRACRGSDTSGLSVAARRGRRRPARRSGPRTVVVAGDDAGPPARTLAEQAGWPLLAEPSSGSRTGQNPIRTYRLLLGTDLGARVERVVVFGHPTLSRPVQRLLARADVEVVSVRARGRWPDRPVPGRRRARRRQRAGRPTTPPGSRSGARPTGRWAAGSTRSWPSSPASRRTTWPRSSTPPTLPAACSSSARATRSATST